MKKILSLLSVVIIALCTFTSCDEDLIISTQLKGTWEGYMDTYYDINGHKQKATYTEIQFFKDAGDTHGEGYWIDHFSNRPGDYYYSRIRWKVIDRDITIDFKDSHTTINIHNYDIVTRNNRKYFTGWFQDDYHTHTEFDLEKTSNEYHYDRDYGYGDGYYDYWGNSKATRSSGNSENVEIPVRRFIKQ